MLPNLTECIAIDESGSYMACIIVYSEWWDYNKALMIMSLETGEQFFFTPEKYINYSDQEYTFGGDPDCYRESDYVQFVWMP